MKAPDWARLIGFALQQQQPCRLRVQTILKIYSSKYNTLRVSCNDGQEYAVKALNAGAGKTRGLVNDHIVAHLGVALGAPVGQPFLVDVPQSILQAQQGQEEFAGMLPGVTHATKFIEKCSEARRVGKKNAQNKAEFSLLAVLYGWIEAHDYAFLFENQRPYKVHSVDHDEFFPREGRLEWDGTTEYIIAKPTPPVPLDWVCQEVGLTSLDLRQALDRLAGVSREDIAAAVASPPDGWGITFAERVYRAKYLDQRKESLLALR